jgi:hypothetical protein
MLVRIAKFSLDSGRMHTPADKEKKKAQRKKKKSRKKKTEKKIIKMGREKKINFYKYMHTKNIYELSSVQYIVALLTF